MKTIASDKSICVVGLGASGLSCARFLARQGRPFALIDTRENLPARAQIEREFSGCPMHFGALDASLLASMDEIFLSPGLSVELPEIQTARDAGAKIRGDIDLFAEHVGTQPIVAITGSNGKSTVTTLVGEMAKSQGLNVAMGGNLGTPALDLMAENVDLYVLELSSFQLETTELLQADAVTLLNISEDHMDRYADKLAYLTAKRRIFLGAKTVAVNDDELLSAPLVSEQMTLVHFGLKSQDLKKFSVAQTHDGEFIVRGFEDLMLVSELAIKGQHNVSNALAALALGSAVGLHMEAKIHALKTFKGLPHRCEWVRTIDGVAFVNDSKGTNVGAALVAINSLGQQAQGKIIWLAGGEGKGADFTPLSEAIRQHVRTAILFGRDADSIAEIAGTQTNVKRAHTLDQALLDAQQSAQPGDVVLLSPACASFDMFDSYEHRGDCFKQAVVDL